MSVLPLKDAYRFGEEKGFKNEVMTIQNTKITWDKSYTSTTRRGWIIKLFEDKNILKDFTIKYWTEADTKSGRTYMNRCKRIADDYDDYLKTTNGINSNPEYPRKVTDDVADDDVQQSAAFQLESHLAEFIDNNWNIVFGTEIKLFIDEHGNNGKEYDTKEVGRIDFLCQDTKGDFVVVELKKGRPTDKVLGQIQRYMGWVLENLAGTNGVKGMILTPVGEDEQLQYALKVAKNIEWKCYKVDFRLVLPETLILNTLS